MHLDFDMMEEPCSCVFPVHSKRVLEFFEKPNETERVRGNNSNFAVGVLLAQIDSN